MVSAGRPGQPSLELPEPARQPQEARQQAFPPPELAQAIGLQAVLDVAQWAALPLLSAA